MSIQQYTQERELCHGSETTLEFRYRKDRGGGFSFPCNGRVAASTTWAGRSLPRVSSGKKNTTKSGNLPIASPPNVGG
jgi:hypothetical protein